MNRAVMSGVVAVAVIAGSAAARVGSERLKAPVRDRIVVVPAAVPAPVAAAATARRPSSTAGSPHRAIWRPAPGDTWQWQLQGTINTSYDVAIYDIDLFDAPNAVIADLHGRGKRVLCYFSAGSAENWRSDYDEFDKKDLGKPLDGWKGERWVDTRSGNVRRIMEVRLDLAATRGCDGVEPDNVEAYNNGSGLGLTAQDQLDYNRFIADAAHARGLSVALKNDLRQVAALAPSFDFAVNEQCFQYRECDTLKPFTDAGKAVLNAEYKAKYRDNTGGARDELCRMARAANIRTLVLPLKLDDAYRYSCD